MTMDLALTVAAPMANAQPQQPAPAGQEAQTARANGQFGRILVAKVGGANVGDGENSQTQAVSPIAWKMTGGEWANLPGGASGESLTDKLDALLKLVESGDVQPSEEQQAEIDAALEELQSLMAAIFGIELPLSDDSSRMTIPAAPQQPGVDLAASAADDPAKETEAAAGTAVRGGLHETIAFVRSFLAEGMFRPLTRQEQAQFESLVARLQQALAPADEAEVQARESGEEPQPVVEIRTNARPSAEALLARLARQPMQASVAAIVSAQRTDASVSSGTPSMAGTAAGTALLNTAPVTGPQPQAFEAIQASEADAVEPLPIAQTVQTNAYASPVADRTETPVRQPAPAVPVERFHEIVSGMAVRQIRMNASEGVSEARILLVPEHLGEVAVRITLQNGQLTAQFVTENAAARELIENQFAQLRIMLQSQGLQVDRLEVTQGNAAAQSQLFQEQRQRGGQARHEGERGRRGDDSAPVFETELIEQAAIRELGYGRAINVKA